MDTPTSADQDRSFMLAVVPSTPCFEKEVTLHRIASSVYKAKQHGATVVVLPEQFNCPYGVNHFPEFFEQITDDSPTIQVLSTAARCNDVYIIGGSMPEIKDGTLYESCPVINRDGNLIGVYRRLHLCCKDYSFDCLPKESDIISAGDSPLIVKTELATFGIGIGFDIYSPELAMAYANAGCEMLVYAAGMKSAEEKERFNTVARVRAVDTKCYVVACGSKEMQQDDAEYKELVAVNPYGTIMSWQQFPDETNPPQLAKFDLKDVDVARRLTEMYATEVPECRLEFARPRYVALSLGTSSSHSWRKTDRRTKKFA
ncbi:hypothetical protein M514_08033 [Trichuris suis]|uniref:omega-amidase n=1 Tax=Trichuris suis TaxID=68888 RepID=A0A085MUU2_9BILA|nr:hypothetical protein M514_08033 [Trichuris suis]